MSRRGKPDDNFIHDEKRVGAIGTGIHLSYVPWIRSLGKKFSRMRRGIAPSRARFNERWI